MADVRRIYGSKTLVIPAGSSLSTDYIDMRRVSDGMVGLSASWTAADIGFKVSSGSMVDNAQLLYDENASLVEISSPSLSTTFKLPSELYSAHYVWLFSQSGGTAVDQSVAASLFVQVKS